MINKNNLDKITPVRFFIGDKAQRKKIMKRYPGRWDNDSHFIRSGMQFFIHHLETEEYNIKEKKRRCKK